MPSAPLGISLAVLVVALPAAAVMLAVGPARMPAIVIVKGSRAGRRREDAQRNGGGRGYKPLVHVVSWGLLGFQAAPECFRTEKSSSDDAATPSCDAAHP